MTFLDIIKFDFINDINDLTEINAVLHVVISILKGRFHDCFLYRSVRCNLDTLIDNRVAFFYIIAFQHREQSVVDKVQQLVSGHSMTVAIGFRPISPSQFFGNDGFVVILVQFPIILFCVIDFQKEHPYHLLNSLGITVDTCVHTHNITDSFYKT